MEKMITRLAMYVYLTSYWMEVLLLCIVRAVAGSENLGRHLVLGGDNVPPLVEIRLTDLPKSGGAPPLATGLIIIRVYSLKIS
jgi:hypothetical protein